MRLGLEGEVGNRGVAEMCEGLRLWSSLSLRASLSVVKIINLNIKPCWGDIIKVKILWCEGELIEMRLGGNGEAEDVIGGDEEEPVEPPDPE